MKLSIRTKLIFSFSLLICLVLVSQLAFKEYYAEDFYLDYMSDILLETYNDLELNFDGTSDSIEELSVHYENQYNLNVMLYSSDGIVYISYNRQLDNMMSSGNQGFYDREVNQPPMIDYPKNPSVEHSLENADNEVLVIGGSFSYEDTVYNMVLSMSVTSIEESATVLATANTNILLIALFICVILSVLISNGITRPLSEVSTIADEYAHLDFTNEANEKLSSKELSTLAVSMNAMKTQLRDSILKLNLANEKLRKDIDSQKDSEQRRREFVANVSHEMKTPLALLQMYSENLKLNFDGLDRGYYCDVIIEESQRLSEMVSEMLKISAMESGISMMEFENFNLSETVLGLVEKLKPILETNKLEVSIEEDIIVLGNSQYLEQAMKNYIINAVEHGHIGGEVKITLTKLEDRCKFSVYNEGSKVKEEDMSQLWDSFYRADKSRTGDTNVGLGLSIVRNVIEQHRGTYGCVNHEHGVEFWWEI